MRKRIAILHPTFLGGGAEAVCVWLLEALKDRYDTTLYTLLPINFEELNKIYGTTLSLENIKIKSVFSNDFALILLHLFKNSKILSRLRKPILMQYFKQQNKDFDLGVSTFNEMDMGVNGIQYLHRPPHRDNRLINWFSDFSEKRMKENLTIANSKSTAEEVKKKYGINPHVIFPPVTSSFSSVNWNNKKEGFICIGRLIEAKQAHRAVKIVGNLREQGYDVHIHVVGSKGDKKYYKLLTKMQRENPSWVFLEKDLERNKLNRLLSDHKYGVHLKPEPFGIVAAEMINAGCITFVRNKGGLLEIVGKHKYLVFENDKDATKKIIKVLSSRKLQQKIRKYLIGRRNLFSIERFQKEIRRVVGDFLSQK
jgi:glycosyltransferase involved in cell wall biosynthesis